jgi:hypothetical protein
VPVAVPVCVSNPGGWSVQVDSVTVLLVQMRAPDVAATMLGPVDCGGSQLFAAENPIVGPCAVWTVPLAEILPCDAPWVTSPKIAMPFRGDSGA